MSDKKRWVLKHPDFDFHYWGWLSEEDEDIIGWSVLQKAHTIESKYKPTYLNFIGSNVPGNAKKMSKGEVVEI